MIADPSVSFPDLADIARYGADPALLEEDGTIWTFAQLSSAVEDLAVRLGPERRLLLVEARNDARTVIALLAALRACCPVILAAPGDPADAIAAAYRPHARIAAPEGGGRPEAERFHSDPIDMHPDLALMLSTSGSTGSPKLVRLSLDALQANAASIASYLGLSRRSRAITSLPLNYSYGLSVVTSHLVAGGSIVLTDRSVAEPAFADLCERHGVTGIAGVPYSYELMERSGLLSRLPASIDTLTQAGGRFAPDKVVAVARAAEARGVRFFVMYGQTEATARMAYLPPDRARSAPDAIGRAIPGGAFHLVDEAGDLVEEVGVAGELVYSGPNVMLGYAQEPADLALGRTIDDLHTGDIATCDTEGLYRIVGRKSRFLKLFGLRIGLDDVERLFRERGIDAIATGDDRLLAIVLAKGTDIAGEQAWIAERLHLPVAAIDISAGEVPRLSSGKPDYAAIKAAAQGRLARDPRPGGSIRDLFADIFPGRTIVPSDTFVTLGGDSLTFVQMSIGLEERLGHIPIDWQDMDVATLEAQTPVDNAGRGFLRPRPLETDVLVRAAAILAVVINHASDSWMVGGGANVLLVLFGLNFLRYQSKHMTGKDRFVPLRNFLVRIIAPYYALLIAYSIASGSIDPASLLLASNFTGRFGSLLEPYWFLEVVAQCLLVITALFWVRPVRALADDWPWPFALAFFLLTATLAVIAQIAAPRPDLAFRLPEFLFWFVALGWAIGLAKLRSQKAILTGIVLMTAGAVAAFSHGQAHAYLRTPSQFLWLAGSVVALLWFPRTALPGFARRAVTEIAGASFQIYLTHNIVVHVFLYVLQYRNLAVILLLSVLTGIAFRRAQALAGGMYSRFGPIVGQRWRAVPVDP